MTALGMRPKYDSIKFEKEGDTVTGTIVDFDDVQMTVYNSSPPVLLFWDDEKTRPKMQTKVTLEREAGNEKSRVNVWIKPGDQAKAVRDAVAATGSRDIELDAVLTVTMTGTRPSKKGGQPAKTYTASYEPPFDPTAGDPPF